MSEMYSPSNSQSPMNAINVSENNYFVMEQNDNDPALEIGIDSANGSGGDRNINIHLSLETTEDNGNGGIEIGVEDEHVDDAITSGDVEQVSASPSYSVEVVGEENVGLAIDDHAENTEDNISSVVNSMKETLNDTNDQKEDEEETDGSNELTEELPTARNEPENNDVPQMSLTILSASQSLPNFDVSVDCSWNVKQLKEHLSQCYPGNPPIAYQKLIFAGNNLLDTDVLQNIIERYQRIQGNVGKHIFHLVVVPPELRFSDDDDDGTDDAGNDPDEDSDDLDDDLNDDDDHSTESEGNQEHMENGNILNMDNNAIADTLIDRAMARVRNAIATELIIASQVPRDYSPQELIELHTLQVAYINLVRLNIEYYIQTRFNNIDSIQGRTNNQYAIDLLQNLYTTHRTLIVLLIMTIRLLFATYQLNIIILILILSLSMWCILSEIPNINRPYPTEENMIVEYGAFGNHLGNRLHGIGPVYDDSLMMHRQLMEHSTRNIASGNNDFIIETHTPHDGHRYNLAMPIMMIVFLVSFIMLIFST